MFSGPRSGDHKVMLTVKSLVPYGLCIIIPLTTLCSIPRITISARPELHQERYLRKREQHMERTWTVIIF
jgi:hypothetical protein